VGKADDEARDIGLAGFRNRPHARKRTLTHVVRVLAPVRTVHGVT
jgi:hypothetical protein